MKKTLIIFLILSFINLNLLALSYGFEDVLEDNLVKTLDKNLKIQPYNVILIEDDFVQRTLNPNLKINKIPYINIADDTIPKPPYNINYIKGDVNQKFDFENINENRLKIKPAIFYSTRTNIKNGANVDFILVEDVKIKNKLYKKGSKVTARVEHVLENGIYGTPSEVVIDNFILASDTKINANISKTGANRSFWLYPTSIILTPFFGLGLLLIPVRGGHVKLKPSVVYDLKFVE